MFFYNQIEYLGHMIYLERLGVQQTKVDAITYISQIPQIQELSLSFHGIGKLL